MSHSESREKSSQRSRGLWFLITGGLLITLLGLFLALRKDLRPAGPDAADVPGPVSATGAIPPRGSRFGSSHPLRSHSNSEPAGTAKEIVAAKLAQFARSRREIVLALARRHNVDVPDDVERFFDAVEAGDWNEIKSRFDAFKRGDGNDTADAPGRRPGMEPLWPAIFEAYGAADAVHKWPAQKLLDYGEAVLGSLRPGMVYVGGTDPGRWIPTMLNETSEGEHHIVLTQNALADFSYLDYINSLYADRFATLTSEENQRAFQEYISGAQKRLEHDQQFPDEPKQIRPGEDIKFTDGRIQVSGQIAVMAINETILQALMAKNPGLSFALEESFPFKSTYEGAAPLGPIMELRAPDGQNALTHERAAQSLDYWRATTQQMLSDPEASSSPETLKSWSKMAVGQANLFAERNYSAEAEQTYRLSMEMWPRNIESVSGLSDLLLRTGRADEARRLLEEFSRNNPDLNSELKRLRSSIGTPPPPPRP
jgi:tetratricopeptide (TPR) repeat protein